MILTVGNTKGDVGKTTLALNIAIARALAGCDVLLVDGDEQGTASLFTELRAQQHGERVGYTAINLQGPRYAPKCANWWPSTTRL